MAPDVPVLFDDSDYASEADSDFAPEAAPPVASDECSTSESEGESGHDDHVKKPKTKAGKRKRAGGRGEEAEDVGFENSGDEEIVEKGLKRQKKKGKKKGVEDEDEGGEGGFVKTRRMAALVTEEKKPLATTATATVDVDALWANMTSGATKANLDSVGENTDADGAADASKSPQTGPKKQQGPDSSPIQNIPESCIVTGAEDDRIMIQRTYNFAGEVHVEEKLVPRDSAEAKLYLQSQPSVKGTPKPSDPNITKSLRPPKRARRSIFEPITEPLPQRSDLRFGANSVIRNGVGIGATAGTAAKKLNTVEKSKMDWAGFVDKEGIKDELETAGKAKGAYLDQREFLARAAEKREEEARRVRMKALQE